MADYTKEMMEELLGETLTDLEFGVLSYYQTHMTANDAHDRANLWTRLDTFRNAPGYFIGDMLLHGLPNLSWEMKRGIWTDGDEILCKTEDKADAIADLLDALGVDAHTGYYDPKEDAKEGRTFETTGFYYVDCD